jgi:hypothetical protein
MPPLAIPEEFWARLLPAWRREPIALRAPFPAPFSEDDVFDAWKTAARALRAGARDVPARLYRGSAPADVARYAPVDEDATFDAWLARIQSEHGEREWGFNLSSPQGWNGPLFRTLLRLLDLVYERTGFARGGAAPDLFYMNHARSFFGLHKDAQDVLTFVVSGTRRYCLWPWDAFAKEAGAPPEGALAPNRLPDVDWAAHRASAVVVEASAGDVLSWPTEWWHAGESTGAPGLTIAVGVMHKANPLRHVARAAEEIGERIARETAPLPYPAHDAAAETLAAELDWTRRLASERAFARELGRDVRAWVTRGGLPRAPAPKTVLSPPGDGDALSLVARLALAFEEDEGTLRCWAAGREITLPARRGLAALLGRLRAGAVHRVADLLAPIPEETRPIARELLARLESFHALERA